MVIMVVVVVVVVVVAAATADADHDNPACTDHRGPRFPPNTSLTIDAGSTMLFTGLLLTDLSSEECVPKCV